MYPINIPSYIEEELRAYADKGVPPGDFGAALISNDLVGSFKSADSINLIHMKEIVTYLYWNMPMACLGSKEIMWKWIEIHRLKREQEHGNMGINNDVV